MLQFQTYDLYLRVSRSPLAARQRTLKSEILTTKSELLKTSAQDQFAKWAKLRRSVDKGLADLEKLSTSHLYYLTSDIFRHPSISSHLLITPADAEVASSKSGFSMKFNSLLWLLTTGMQFAVGWWYRKQPVFYLPEGWFGPLNWWLSFPFAPAGMSPFLVALHFLRAFGFVFRAFCSCFSDISLTLFSFVIPFYLVPCLPSDPTTSPYANPFLTLDHFVEFPSFHSSTRSFLSPFLTFLPIPQVLSAWASGKWRADVS